MNDPWSQIRERADGMYEHKYGEMVLSDALERLLTDADALLAVVRKYAGHDDVCDHADPCMCGFSAALPEHLK